KEHPHTRQKLCQKAKVAQKDTRGQGQKSKGQALRMTIYPSHGYARILICSLPAFVILISQKGPACQVTSKHMTKVRIQKITSRSFRQQQKWNVGQCQHGATCLTPHLPDPPGYGLTTSLLNPQIATMTYKRPSWKIFVSKKSTAKILWKSTMLSSEKESLRKILCVDSRLKIRM
nr:hypothetical protein [Tanacetum cinerariifolium]